MELQTLQNSLKRIDEMLSMSSKDSSIDVEDLRQERFNCSRAIRKIKRDKGL